MRACTRAGARGRVPSGNALSSPAGAPAELCRTLLKRSCIAADPLPAPASCCGDRGAAEMGFCRTTTVRLLILNPLALRELSGKKLSLCPFWPGLHQLASPRAGIPLAHRCRLYEVLAPPCARIPLSSCRRALR
eukprot:228307-Pyramimonas_sp.AAC.1